VSDPRFGITSLADLGVTISMPEVDMILRSTFAPLFGATIDDQAVGSSENDSPRWRNASSPAVPSR
jgi:hypothetical protein